MPARAFVIRFPDGDFEYDVTRSVPPSVGETLRRRGVTWCVTERTQEDVLTIHVERVERRGGETPAEERTGVPSCVAKDGSRE